MIRLIVYTSEPLSSLALTTLFQSCEDICLLPVVSDLSRFTDQVANSDPDVVLLSVDGGVDWGLLNALRFQAPKSRLVLWLHEVAPELAYQAIECGVCGILRKSLPAEMITKCVRKVYAGELWLEKTLTQTFLSGRRIRVSRRENQLITLVSQGLKNKEIASVMNITEGTVKVYLSRLFEKVRVRDRFELALFGLRNSPNQADSPGSNTPVFTSMFVAADPLEPTHSSPQTQSVGLFPTRAKP
ncbi:MAG: response regulator transcription factor [Acidobacteriia bacterium]|nr:response regulator transcription factor [Terriglobia bacterium]